MSNSITFTLDLTVDDEETFRMAARDRALADGLENEEAMLYLTEEKTLEDCAVMVLDPGLSPPGSSILQSGAH